MWQQGMFEATVRGAKTTSGTRVAARGASLAALTALTVSLGLAGCAAGSPVGSDCDSGADCESGACRDGVCVEEATTSSSGVGGMGSGGSGSTQASTSSSGSGGNGTCSPNGDGTIERTELPLGPGLSATYRVVKNTTVDTAGTGSGSDRVWDFSGAFPGDSSIVVETTEPTGTWYQGLFAGASYSSRLSGQSDLLGVFALSDNELSLLGVVSPVDGLSRTELSYSTPIPTLKFPLQSGLTWSTDSTVTGLTSGVFSNYTEQYDFSVDAVGTAKTPFADFAVLRVQIDLTRWVGAVLSTQRSFVFVSECFGPVATVVSQFNEQSVEFTNASELRRLTP